MGNLAECTYGFHYFISLTILSASFLACELIVSSSLKEEERDDCTWFPVMLPNESAFSYIHTTQTVQHQTTL